MSSTISKNLTVGDTVYVPFWVVLEYLDNTPPDAFVSCQIINKGVRSFNNGDIQIEACDLEIKEGLVAYTIPVDHILSKNELPDWANKIAQWFVESAGKYVD